MRWIRQQVFPRKTGGITPQPLHLLQKRPKGHQNHCKGHVVPKPPIPHPALCNSTWMILACFPGPGYPGLVRPGLEQPLSLRPEKHGGWFPNGMADLLAYSQEPTFGWSIFQLDRYLNGFCPDFSPTGANSGHRSHPGPSVTSQPPEYEVGTDRSDGKVIPDSRRAAWCVCLEGGELMSQGRPLTPTFRLKIQGKEERKPSERATTRITRTGGRSRRKRWNDPVET